MLMALTLDTLSVAYAKPQAGDAIFQGARWALDSGIKLTSDEPLSRYGFMGFTGLDFYSELRLFGKHRGNIVAQVYLFDFGSFGLSEAPQNMFTYAPCVIAPELSVLSRGRLNLKFGHIWPSYGLRNDVNTTQTLRQLIDHDNIGLGSPVDWGAELNGQAVGTSYHLTLTRGSGKWWSSAGDRYILSGRLGLTESNRFAQILDTQIGLSGMASRLAGPTGLVERWRAGVDLQYSRLISILFEGSIGQDYTLNASGDRGPGSNILNVIGEIGWRSPSERWFVYTQVRYLSSEVFSIDSLSVGNASTEMTAPSDDLHSMIAEVPEFSMILAQKMGAMSQVNNQTFTQVKDSVTFGILYEPVRSLYVGSELAVRRGETRSQARLHVRYRW